MITHIRINSGNFALLLLLFLLFAGCSSDQTVKMRNDGSGEAHIELDLHPFFVQYLKDLSAGLTDPGSASEDFRVFDEGKIAASFARIDGAELTSFTRYAPGHIEINAAFSDPALLLPKPEDPDLPPLIQFGEYRQEQSIVHTLAFTLTSRNVSSLYSLLGVEEQQNMLTFGPQRDPLSENEYVDMMTYALGTYSDQQELAGILGSQQVTLSIEVEGEIVSASGLTVEDGKAKLELPFLQPATLEEPVQFSLSWKE